MTVLKVPGGTRPLEMRLAEIVKALDGAVKNGASDPEISGVTPDSRAARGGALFVAVKGEHADGHDYVKAATEAGAAAVVAEREAPGLGVPLVLVRDSRAALSRASAIFYGEPSKRMTLAGVTGTNGKTTTTYLMESVFRAAGFSPGVIGTVNYRYGGKVFSAPHTTPEAPELQRTLREMADAGTTHCVMEVSSHALAQKRVADCCFSAAVFTNLTHEHLDYHKTMEEYFRCKSMLFSMTAASGGVLVVNADDRWGRELKRSFPSALTYSLGPGADIFPEEKALGPSLTEAAIRTPRGVVIVASHLVGEYNLQNLLAAAGAVTALGIGTEAAGRGLSALQRVPGRLDKIEAGDFTAYVDYAHTGDALERALNALKAIAKGRLITVFGCGGNRDRTKRPEMGEISARLSDITIVTSDNPRDEDPLEIIREIEAGMKGVEKRSPAETPGGRCYMVIPSRAEAIRKAVELARSGDTLLVAGKGHEDYQIVKGVKHHFDDHEVLSGAVEGLGRAQGL